MYGKQFIKESKNMIIRYIPAHLRDFMLELKKKVIEDGKAKKQEDE